MEERRQVAQDIAETMEGLSGNVEGIASTSISTPIPPGPWGPSLDKLIEELERILDERERKRRKKRSERDEQDEPEASKAPPSRHASSDEDEEDAQTEDELDLDEDDDDEDSSPFEDLPFLKVMRPIAAIGVGVVVGAIAAGAVAAILDDLD